MQNNDLATQRKDSSERLLKSLNVPVNSSLPVIESELDARIRTSQDVARRATILYSLVAVAHDCEREGVIAWLKDENLWDATSKPEKLFLQNANASEEERIHASWRAESLFVLLWALQKIENIKLPTDICDVGLMQDAMPELGAAYIQFMSNAALRPTTQILDATDLIYRIHWAVRDAQLNNRQTPNDFNKGVVYERHYALNWLTYYADGWDDITTDT